MTCHTLDPPHVHTHSRSFTHTHTQHPPTKHRRSGLTWAAGCVCPQKAAQRRPAQGKATLCTSSLCCGGSCCCRRGCSAPPPPRPTPPPKQFTTLPSYPKNLPCATAGRSSCRRATRAAPYPRLDQAHRSWGQGLFRQSYPTHGAGCRGLFVPKTPVYQTPRQRQAGRRRGNSLLGTRCCDAPLQHALSRCAPCPTMSQ